MPQRRKNKGKIKGGDPLRRYVPDMIAGNVSSIFRTLNGAVSRMGFWWSIMAGDWTRVNFV